MERLDHEGANSVRDEFILNGLENRPGSKWGVRDRSFVILFFSSFWLQ